MEDIPLEFNDESLHIVSQEIMEQKTENEFDDKVFYLFLCLFCETFFLHFTYQYL